MNITEKNYVDTAEKVISGLKEEKERNARKQLVSTTKLRGLLSMLSDIYNDVLNHVGEQLDDRICARIDYLRVRFIYESRERTVKEFVEKAELLNCLKSVNGKKSGFLLFYHYMEALVAYFKFYDLDTDR